MVVLRSHGIGVLILFTIDAEGIVVVSELHLSIRFSLKPSTIWVEREIFHPDTRLVVHTFHESTKQTNSGNVVWELGMGKYRVYGLPDSQMGVSTEILAPLRSSTAAFSTPPVISVKTKHVVDNVIDLSDSLTEDVPMHKVVVHDSPPLFPSSSYVTPSPSSYVPSTPSVPTSKPPQTIVQCLRPLGSMPDSKNVFKKIDYNKIKIQEVNHLPPRFNGTQLCVLPAAEVSSSQTKAKSLDGMNKQYDGHVWTKTQTTNITNDVGLTFRSSACVGHLQCQNQSCDYLQRAHRTSKVNDTGFEGFTKDHFPLSSIVRAGSTLVCKICKEPPKCIALCQAKIFYVHGKVSCIHLGTHQHPVKVGDCKDSRKRINSLLKKHVERTPQATYNMIVLEANKDIVGEVFLSADNDTHRLLSLKELEHVFESCRELNSPNLRSKVTLFKYLRKFGVMDGIAKLRDVSNWAYVQRNQFLGQGDDTDKLFVFKMSEVGPGSGVDLVRRM